MVSRVVVIDARMNGYAGQPTRMVATLDVTTGHLVVSGEKPYKPVPRERSIAEKIKLKLLQSKTIIITDSPDTLSNWDLLYKEIDHLNEVVRAFNTLKRDKLLTLDKSIQGRFNPDNVLQPRKLDINNGALWELSTETENGHLCILAACWGAMKATNNFMFAAQVNQDLSSQTTEQKDDDFLGPFTI